MHFLQKLKSISIHSKYIALNVLHYSSIKDKVTLLSWPQLKEIEAKWKKCIFSNEVKKSKRRPKKYVLSMFPYPSGHLHMGHVRVYTISDVMARIYRMKGYDVIHPMGWDAFGLPAENAAIERGEIPEIWTKKNISRMKSQLVDLGFQFDWWREFATCDSEYYKWTQLIFLKLFHAQLAYRQEALVNWDPVDKTVLANEQVDENGCSWRSGAQVEKKLLTQWFIKTTSLSNELYEALDDPSLESWRDIPLLQKGWIGECNGYIVELKVQDSSSKNVSFLCHLPVWLSDKVSLDSVAFISVKSSHILNKQTFVDKIIDGVRLLNIKAVNPLNTTSIPIIVNDELECGLGSDIYVGLPSQNDIDENLCIKLNIKVPPAIENEPKRISEDISKLIDINAGGYRSSAKLKDWLISRQRFWGTPIPIVYCDSCGTVPVPEEDLPVKLPKFEGRVGKGINGLKEFKHWYHCSCPSCGEPAFRETDTMDTFVDSSWYFLRFLDPTNTESLVDKDKEEEMMPVDLYVGGKEHAILHLYYARFMQRCLHIFGLVTHKEPFRQLLVQGMVKGKTYQVKETGKYLRPDEVDLSVSPPVEMTYRLPLTVQFEKMSKSKHNGVDPQELLDEFGVDAVRLAILSNFGPHSDRSWDNNDLRETYQILNKVWKVVEQFELFHKENYPSGKDLNGDQVRKHETFLFETKNQLLLRANNYLESAMQFHSAIRCTQQLCTALLRVPEEMMANEEFERGVRCLLLILSPMCPHFCSELWKRMNQVSILPQHKGVDSAIVTEDWPEVDPSYKMEVDFKVNEEDVLTMRLSQEEYSELTKDKVMQLAKDNGVISSLISDSPILEVVFKYNPNFKANVSIFTKSSTEIKQMKKSKKKAK